MLRLICTSFAAGGFEKHPQTSENREKTATQKFADDPGFYLLETELSSSVDLSWLALLYFKTPDLVRILQLFLFLDFR